MKNIKKLYDLKNKIAALEEQADELKKGIIEEYGIGKHIIIDRNLPFEITVKAASHRLDTKTFQELFPETKKENELFYKLTLDTAVAKAKVINDDNLASLYQPSGANALLIKKLGSK